MATPEQVLQDLSDFVRDIPKKAVAGTTVAMLQLKDELVSRAPIDEGHYRAGWAYSRNRGGGKLASGSVFNTVHYGYFLELGSEEGKRPWPNVGPKTLFGGNGRIYSSQAFQGAGGTVKPLLTNQRVDQMVNLIADRIMSGLK